MSLAAKRSTSGTTTTTGEGSGAEFAKPQLVPERDEQTVLDSVDAQPLIANLAYEFWEQRGRPLGTPEVDWFAAEKALATSRDGSSPANEGMPNGSQPIGFCG